jgi:Cytochrome c554 and c-prime
MINPRTTTNSIVPYRQFGKFATSYHRVFFAAVSCFCVLLTAGSTASFGQIPPAPSPISIDVPPDFIAPSIVNNVKARNFPSNRFLGSQSCSASNCHGNPRRESISGSAAHFFFERDRHQRGGAVLREKRSKEIAERLNLPQPAWKTNECLVCHAPGAMNAENPQDFHVKLADGVGCESCHGPAQNWLTHHHTLEWKFREIWSSEIKQELGFRETKNLLNRVNDCADCHVGNAIQSVNHDLIAAGHPRLVFEYAAYLASMPAHWRRSEDRQRQSAGRQSSISQSNSEVRDWLLGQFVNAEHELRILSATASNPNAAWPELAQYDCFGCHHDLKSKSWQQARIAWELKPGEFQWGTWNLGLLPELKTTMNDIVDNRLLERLSALQRTMKSSSVKRESVSAAVRELQHELRQAALSLDRTGLRSENVVAVRQMLLKNSARFTNQGWDRSTQLYLCLVAIDIGLSETSDKIDHMNPTRELTYRQLRQQLAFRDSTKLIPPLEHRESPFRLQDHWESIRQGFDDLTIQLSSEPQK